LLSPVFGCQISRDRKGVPARLKHHARTAYFRRPSRNSLERRRGIDVGGRRHLCHSFATPLNQKRASTLCQPRGCRPITGHASTSCGGPSAHTRRPGLDTAGREPAGPRFLVGDDELRTNCRSHLGDGRLQRPAFAFTPHVRTTNLDRGRQPFLDNEPRKSQRPDPHLCVYIGPAASRAGARLFATGSGIRPQGPRRIFGQ